MISEQSKVMSASKPFSKKNKNTRQKRRVVTGKQNLPVNTSYLWRPKIKYPSSHLNFDEQMKLARHSIAHLTANRSKIKTLKFFRGISRKRGIYIVRWYSWNSYKRKNNSYSRPNRRNSRHSEKSIIETGSSSTNHTKIYSTDWKKGSKGKNDSSII